LGGELRVAVSAPVPADHPMVRKVSADGFHFLEWPTSTTGTTGGRLLRAARRTLLRRVVPWLAGRGNPDAALPSTACRTAFALSTLVAPLDDVRLARGRAIDELVGRSGARLVLSEGNEEWLPVVASARGVDWAYYTTGPVLTVTRGRPVGPAGFAPRRRGAERVANELLLGAKELRNRRRARVLERSAAKAFGPLRRAPAAKLSFSVPELDDSAALAPHDLEYAGLFPYRPPAWWPADDAPIERGERDTVVWSGGSGDGAAEAHFVDALVSTLEHLDRNLRVVVYSTDDQLQSRLAHVGSIEVRAPDDAPPYDEFARARLVITHGGYGTIKEAVACGAPVLVAAQVVADRMETSRRVLTSGVGASVNRATVTSAQLSCVIDAVMADERVAAQVRDVGRALRDPAPREAALALVHELLDRTG
jgi:UDP:flavonoid glycosyltransferase YjiC (YdhE family)